MRNTKTQYSQPTARKLSMCLGLLCVTLLLAFAVTASAQNVTQLNVPTTTTLWAGTQDFAQFGLSSVTLPASGVILQGTAISQFTGQPVRHLWYGDASNGFCRIDPEIDDPNLTQPAPGIGRFNNNILTCVGAIQAGAFAPMQATYDASTNTIYAADIPRTANGVIRLHYIPSGDNGQGSIDPIHVQSLMGNQGTRNAAGGCPVVTDPRTGAIPETMTSATLGPDGNLYVGWARNGTIARIPNPATFDPTNDADCASIDVPIFAADARLGAGGAAGHTFGMAWIGHTLFGADNISPWFKDNADQCLTPANGNLRCGPTSAQGIGTEILGAFVPGPQAGIVSDFTYNGPNTTFPGNALYAATLSGMARIINATDVNNISITPSFGGTFCFLVGSTIDTTDLANETVYAGVDCTQGSINGAAAIYKIVPQPPAGAPAAVPTSVTASNATPPGALAGAANVGWIPGSNGQKVSGFLVRTVLAADGTTLVIPDTVVGPAANGVPPNVVQITGLPLGTAVEFMVASTNSFGTSQFSIPTAAFTAFVPTPPGAPTGVVATAGNASAQVAWSAPSSNGGLPITSYTVTAQLNGSTSAGNVTVAAPATGVNFTGLANGSLYNFVVTATNAAGNSSFSLPSNAVTPVVPNIQDLAVSMSSPSSVNPGSFVTFTIGVSNLGPGDAPNVTLADNLPAPLVSFTTTQGACSVLGSAFSCTLGGMHAGTSATVKVTVAAGTSAITNSATATLRDLLGNVQNTDPNLANNTASSTTGITSGGGSQVSADIQTVGSSNNGGPAVGSNVLFTWQTKNNTGNVTAPNVTFEVNLPASFQLVPGSLSTSIGGCSISGQTLDCTTPTLAGGTTMVVTYSITTTQTGSFTTTGTNTSGAKVLNAQHTSFPVTIQPK
ncbi:MAG TPA: fibronectin type III domain-containing protein [Candidatus Angelobacter sp.]|nr:fibronectin type III domain-containing protein [Candidatus Angelobacter sp.]